MLVTQFDKETEGRMREFFQRSDRRLISAICMGEAMAYLGGVWGALQGGNGDALPVAGGDGLYTLGLGG